MLDIHISIYNIVCIVACLFLANTNGIILFQRQMDVGMAREFFQQVDGTFNLLVSVWRNIFFYVAFCCMDWMRENFVCWYESNGSILAEIVRRKICLEWFVFILVLRKYLAGRSYELLFLRLDICFQPTLSCVLRFPRIWNPTVLFHCTRYIILKIEKLGSCGSIFLWR